MKHLLILRHAKAVRDDAEQADFQRPLAPRGEKDAPGIGKALRERGVLPDLIFCSPAKRARQTMEAVRKAAHLEIAPQFRDNLYGASAHQWKALVSAFPDTAACALL